MTSVDGVQELVTSPGIDSVNLRRRAGDAVDWRAGTDSAVMTVRGRVPTYDQLGAVIEYIRHKVTFRYDE